MILLALESTDERASLALLTQAGCREVLIQSPLRHEQTLMPAVDALLSEEDITPSDLTALAVDVGPGSFTGVRIGVCHANAMAAALDIPVIPVNALEALSYPHLQQDRPVAAIIDARNGNGYGALYAPDGTQLLPPAAIEIDPFLRQLPQNAILTGTGAPQGDGALPAAGAVARLAQGRPGQKEAHPLYLRPSQAERMHKG